MGKWKGSQRTHCLLSFGIAKAKISPRKKISTTKIAVPRIGPAMRARKTVTIK
ncbi:MAG: hypothetical protein QXQ69_03420 [Candidatus Aenigmatarchaeota archaeon]